jgi:ABC-2 type transport system ATP-binding protein
MANTPNSHDTIIEVKNIRRGFRSVKKQEGLKGSLGLILNPQYSEHEALKGVSFQIERGSFTGLIGANGAGKTTLLKILSGLIPPSSGEARVLGLEPFKRSLDFRRQISLVMGQKAQLWWDLPAIDAFDLLRAIYEIPNNIYKERLETLSELLDVKRHMNTQIRRLSLGERMKMELIGAIIHWPSVIFLDEPTIGLDVLAAHKLREFLRVFNQREKATIILTSHNMDDIEKLCSRVLILRNGEILTPSIEELARETGIDAKSISQSEAEEGTESRTTHFAVKQDQIVHTLQKLMGRFEIVDMGIEEQSLEQVIQRIYEEPAK